jgi:hypothetical protein
MKLAVFVEAGPNLLEYLNRRAQSSLERLGVAEHKVRLEYRIGMSRRPDPLHRLSGKPATARKVPGRKRVHGRPGNHMARIGGQ